MNKTGINPAALLAGKLNDMTAVEAVKMARELCIQLEHDASSFHGNIWPGNVQLDWDGKAVLGEGSQAPVSQRNADQVEFLAPEFFWEDTGSTESDVYSIGLLIYAVCTGGYMPFQPREGALTDRNRSDALRQRMKGIAYPMPAGISATLSSVLEKALAFEPEERYISAAELLSALNETNEALAIREEDESTVGSAAILGADFVGSAEPVEDWSEEAETATEAEYFEEAPVSGSDKKAAEAVDDLFAEFEQNSVYDEDSFWKAESPEEESVGEETLKEETAATEEIDEKADGSVGFIAAAMAAEEAQAGDSEKRNTVQKNHDRSSSHRKAAHQASGRQKKKKSPMIPILCVVAACVIVAVAVYFVIGSGVFTDREQDETVSNDSELSSLVDDIAATEPPTAAVPEVDEEEEEEEPEPEEVLHTGSAVVDGMEVTPVSDTVYVDEDVVNLRSGPGTDYDVEDTVTQGTSLSRTGTVNDWSQVQYNGSEYYIINTLITETSPDDNEDNVDDDNQALVLNVGFIGENEVEAAYSSAGDNTESNAGNDAGANSGTDTDMNTDADTETDVNANTSSNANAGSAASVVVTAVQDVVEVAKDEVNVRSGPDTSYNSLGVINSGTVLQRTGTVSNGWSKVIYQGQEAYVDSSLLTIRSETAETAAVGTLKVTSTVNVRNGAGTDFSILGVAEAGETLSITGIVGAKWYRVSYLGEEGYVNRNLISVQDFALITEKSGTVTVIAEANIRSGPDTDYSIVDTVTVGTVLTITGLTDSGWYQLSYNGGTAYIAENLVQ